MQIGMLWWDNSQSSLNSKIQRAMAHYHRKYGRTPTLCMINPSALEKVEIQGLTVKPYKSVLPNHIWIGIEDKN